VAIIQLKTLFAIQAKPPIIAENQFSNKVFHIQENHVMRELKISIVFFFSESNVFTQIFLIEVHI
jgi:hypothetical protein